MLWVRIQYYINYFNLLSFPALGTRIFLSGWLFKKCSSVWFIDIYAIKIYKISSLKTLAYTDFLLSLTNFAFYSIINNLYNIYFCKLFWDIKFALLNALLFIDQPNNKSLGNISANDDVDSVETRKEKKRNNICPQRTIYVRKKIALLK